MTARANIAIADGESSPVTHTFVPYGDVSEGLARFINRNTTVPAASEVLTLNVKSSGAQSEELMTPGKKVSPDSVELRIQYPATFVDANTGLTQVDFSDLIVVTMKSHPRSTDQRRKNLRTMAQNAIALAITQVSNAFDKNEPVW